MPTTPVQTCVRCRYTGPSWSFTESYCSECSIENYDMCRSAKGDVWYWSDERWAKLEGEPGSVLLLSPEIRAFLARHRHEVARAFYAWKKKLVCESGHSQAVVDFRSARQGVVWV
jgi:hypothetical protein